MHRKILTCITRTAAHKWAKLHLLHATANPTFNDPEFKPYGRVVTGLDTAKAEILAAWQTPRCPQLRIMWPRTQPCRNCPPPSKCRSIFSAACPANWLVQRSQHLLNCLEYHATASSIWVPKILCCCLPGRRKSRAASWTPPRSRRSASRQAHWWKSTPRRCTTRPAMWTQPRLPRAGRSAQRHQYRKARHQE